jgi:hypothetical protein
VERQLQRIRDLWSEASDAQIAPDQSPAAALGADQQFDQVLLGHAHCKPCTERSEHVCRRVEDWAAIAQATVDDARVPYNYPKPPATNLVKPLDPWYTGSGNGQMSE